MPELIHQCISQRANTNPEDIALLFKDVTFNYAQLSHAVQSVSQGLQALRVNPDDRVAVYLPKQPETVFSIFGAAEAGACFVPINPLLKPHQVCYILSHCQVKVLITSQQRLTLLTDALKDCPDLETVIVVEEQTPAANPQLPQNIIGWAEFTATEANKPTPQRIDSDIAAILYTSGSTGNPKGVVLSHRNMVAGASSVASYLENTPKDRLLGVLPLSFDAGLSQLTTAFSAGASVVLMDYLLPRDVIRAVCRYRITGLAAVPPLWNQLVGLDWPQEARSSLRYITNTGGAMPVATTRGLQKSLPHTDIFLMYGLTEAFRSTYLPPDQVDIRPESMGKAIPNVEILVINSKGEECAPGEAGELVHRGALVAMGYWNDPEKTAIHFKPCPGQAPELPITELAVWSGDQVRKDEEGYLYFVSRQDEMIKTSGYRVSPTEVEEVVYSSKLVSAAVAIGLTHPTLGQAILLIATPANGVETSKPLESRIIGHCRRELPNFMLPQALIVRESLPHNQNGKIDRKYLSAEYQTFFLEATAQNQPTRKPQQ